MEAADAETEVEQSRFLCRVRRAGSEPAARAVVAQARGEHRHANHHCSALVIGPSGDLRRSSDDGEPSGTAGRPMLDVLGQHGLSDVVAVVTRYFGGVKLGTGGLARAYSEVVGLAVDAAPRIHRLRMRECLLALSHTDAGRVEHALRGAGVDVRDTTYGESAILRLLVPDDGVDALRQRLAALHVGTERLRAGDLRWHDVG